MIYKDKLVEEIPQVPRLRTAALRPNFTNRRTRPVDC